MLLFPVYVFVWVVFDSTYGYEYTYEYLYIIGLVGEEKEVVAILGKMKESKTKKSFSSFELLARNISFKYLTSLLVPLKETMEKTDAHKVIMDCQLVFSQSYFSALCACHIDFI